MPGFNLIEEHWLPCITSDGQRKQLGIRDALVRAHILRELHDVSPLVTASLHRLLLAILHRVFGPQSVDDWQKLWQAGHFDPLPLESYLQKWHSRFYLFDDQFPFYQVADFQTKSKTPLKRLAFEYAAQNNATLFDHSNDNIRPEYPASQAARWLLTSQAFYPTAGKSVTIHTKDSPWSRGAVLISYGNTLFETLMFNMIPDELRNEALQPPGIPAWENSQPLIPEHSVVPGGYLEYLTWQSRTIHLIPVSDADEQYAVSECYLAQGKSLMEDFREDPLLAYQKGEKAISVWQLKRNKAVWRDSASLFSRHTGPFQSAPLTLELFAQLVERGTLRPDQAFQLAVLGQCLKPGQPTIHFWRHERLPLPMTYLGNEEHLNDLSTCLEWAEGTGKALSKATWEVARGLADDKNSLNNIAKHLGVPSIFWSRLEEPFYRIMKEIPDDPNTALDRWVNLLRKTAWEAFDEGTRGLDHSARTLKALVVARGVLGAKLKKVLPKGDE